MGGGTGGVNLVMPVKKALAEGKKVSVTLGAKNRNQLAKRRQLEDSGS